MINKTELYAFLAIPLLVFMSAKSLYAQEDNWPCNQVLVPAVSASVVWPELIDEAFATQQFENTEFNNIAANLAGKFRVNDDDLAPVRARLEGLSTASRPQEATALFVVTLRAFNQKRRKYIDGIKKATSKQKYLSDRLVYLLDHRDQLQREGLPADELVDEIPTVEQVFKRRENILSKLCEQPVLVENNLGVVARALAEYLD